MSDPDADFAAYFAGRVTPLRRTAYALCGDWHTADDLVQATFVKVFPRWRRVRDGSPDAYVHRTLVNTYLSLARKQRREKVVADVPDRPAPPVELHDDLHRALRKLTPKQRAVVVLRHLDDLSITEVARILHLAEGTVKSQSTRAIAALRASMAFAASRER